MKKHGIVIYGVHKIFNTSHLAILKFTACISNLVRKLKTDVG
jgi:hypothetical protein